MLYVGLVVEKPPEKREEPVSEKKPPVRRKPREKK